MSYKGEELYEPNDLGDYLAHTGRKGMKWYQHIFGDYQNHAKYARNKTTKKTKSKKEQKEQAKKKANEILNRAREQKNYKKMTSEDLQKRIDRLNLEKQYLDLNRETRTTGKRLTDSFLKVMEKTAFDVLQGSLTNVGKKYVSKFLDEQVEIMLKQRSTESKKKKK